MIVNPETGRRARVSVIIKTLNEEAHIAQAIESALKAVAPFDGDVTVVDSISSDHTVAIAARYPIRVISLAAPSDRSCGIGPELGYRESPGEYVYLLDGDMELDADFLREAVSRLDTDSGLAGVGGRIEDVHSDDIDSKVRIQRAAGHTAGAADRLNGGGLYRRSAIEQLGYLGDRNLHSFEEFDLGARLLGRGWRIIRLDRRAVRHFGYTVNPYRLLLRRFRTGYIFGTGEIVRASISAGYTGSLVRLRGLGIAAGLLVFWSMVIVIALAGAGWMAGLVAVAVPLVAVGVMSLRRRSLEIGVYSVVAWHASALGLLVGFLRPRTSPTAPIRSRLLRTPVSPLAAPADDGQSFPDR
ncbi:MAG: glycosyltransferase [Bauldia sp.]|nr:glycosyltransferase [Bauldia sp.]